MHIIYLFVNVAAIRWQWRATLGFSEVYDGVDGS